MGDHTLFIVAAYAVTTLVLGGAVAGVLLDYRTQSRLLARLGGRADTRAMAREGDDDDAR